MHHASILVVGSLNVDYVAYVARAPRPGETVTGTRFATHPGGKGANQAYAASRLGGRVALVGRIGGDTQGAWLRDHLARGGVDTRSVGEEAGVSTGVALIVVDDAGQNSIIVIPGANARLRPPALAAASFADAGVVLLQLEVPIETVREAALRGRAAGAVVILDPAPAAPVAGELLAAVHYLTPNETELLTLCQERAGADAGAGLSVEEAGVLARRLVGRGAAKVIVKLGARGALLVSAQGERLEPAPRVDAIDTTAAGDVLNAGFAVGLAEGLDEAAALRLGVTAASVSVTAEGAQTGMPSREAVAGRLGR